MSEADSTSGARRAERIRETKETTIRVAVDLDGSGLARIASGVGFYDHLLGSLSHHSLIDIEIAADGDLEIDEHHTVEDVALTLGAAISDALGDRAGINRFGAASVPMDESLARCALDLSGRPYAVIDLPFRGERIGELSTQLVEHALESFAQSLGATIHISGHGRNDHHLAEAAFKSLARSLRTAVERDPRRSGVASTKGSLASVGDPGDMTATTRVAVVDYGAGNLVSIRNALGLLGAEAVLATRAPDLEGAAAILVPGVGASAPAMARLRRQDLVAPIIDRVAAGAWYVGICLGLQLLFERSHEDDAAMLALLTGDVVRIDAAPSLPHIGWNRVERVRDHALLAGLPDATPAYFVHSYVPSPTDPGVIVAETEHGSRFASIVAHDRIIGFQFHPERSGRDGLRMLANLLGMIGADAPTRAPAAVTD